MYLRLLSDIHLELAHDDTQLISKFVPNSPSEDILILAGDIGDPTGSLYQSFVTEMARYYAKVFLVAGNHEYYQRETFDQPNKSRLSIDEINKIIINFTDAFVNVHYIQQNIVIHNRVRFLGCTLWTKSDPILSYKIGDYKHILNLTPEKCTELHNYDINWLETQLSCPNDGTYDFTVVMSHHLPSYKLVSEKYQDHPLNGFYADDLDHLVKKANMWVCGHTHYAKHILVGDCHCYVNPIGYSHETSNYDPNILIELVLPK
jgi:DNA repair exonuclease SbcCD nuclease subunit